MTFLLMSFKKKGVGSPMKIAFPLIFYEKKHFLMLFFVFLIKLKQQLREIYNKKLWHFTVIYFLCITEETLSFNL